MESKYYTPTIEEFHVGFEYEMKEGFTDGTVKTQENFDKAKWESRVCDSGIMYIERALQGRNAKNGLCGIRVKLLDREDIEREGFIYSNVHSEYWSLNGFDLAILGDNYFTIYEDKGADEFCFRGKIKNKSELQKLMIQLGIK